MMQNIKLIDQNKLVPFLLDKAENISKYAGISWMIYKQGKILSLSGSIQGVKDSNLIDDILEFGKGACVYLSFPPNSLFIDAQKLMMTAIQAKVSQLLIPKITNELSHYLEPVKIQSSNSLKITRLTDLVLKEQPYITAFTFMKQKRPWVTCITSEVEHQQKNSFDELLKQFGVLNHTQRIIKENQICAFESSFCNFDISDVKNNLRHEITQYPVKTLNCINKLLDAAYAKKITSLVLIISPSIATQLLEIGVIDEIIYYQSICRNEASGKSQTINLNNDWTIRDCIHFNKGIRFSAQKSVLNSLICPQKPHKGLH